MLVSNYFLSLRKKDQEINVVKVDNKKKEVTQKQKGKKVEK